MCVTLTRWRRERGGPAADNEIGDAGAALAEAMKLKKTVTTMTFGRAWRFAGRTAGGGAAGVRHTHAAVADARQQTTVLGPLALRRSNRRCIWS